MHLGNRDNMLIKITFTTIATAATAATTTVVTAAAAAIRNTRLY